MRFLPRQSHCAAAMPVKIYPPVEARLLEIWNYSCEKWGEEQADSYVRNLFAALNSLPTRRKSWRSFQDKMLPGVWFVRHENHFIFFRELPGGSLGIISILHEAMNLPARLKEDEAWAKDS